MRPRGEQEKVGNMDRMIGLHEIHLEDGWLRSSPTKVRGGVELCGWHQLAAHDCDELLLQIVAESVQGNPGVLLADKLRPVL